jgi:predicted ATPase/signal transduction histidine kinase
MSVSVPSNQVFVALRRDEELCLYRGARDAAGSACLVLAATADRPSLRTLQRLEQEYALCEELDDAWAARPLALVNEAEGPKLLLSDPGGELLSRLVGRLRDPGSFMRVAIGIAGALARMHDRGLIHKDIKPANILVDGRTGQAWLTGFAIASRQPREHPLPGSPTVISGTLAYMAPEQTGRMNRSVDSRSDLYALGATLYEALTGELPFSATDPIELIHCHIASQPVPPEARVAGVPAQLGAVVMKLLSKTAEERYQTAAGVEADLRRCLSAWEANGAIAPFPLGVRDTSSRLMIPERLYGRDAETAVLLAAFEQVVANGDPELVLVSGYSGIGKSSLVSELHKVIVLPRGIFISGKFDQRLKDVPYSTLAQAFQGLVQQVLASDERELGRWREALQEALGGHGGLMMELIPELVAVIGPQPPVPALQAPEAQLRFQFVFQRFIGVFANAQHPLVIFLDDLQWLDPATLTLLEQLVTQSDIRHLLLIGAYRDNEVGPSHPLALALQKMRTAGARIDELVLGPLSRGDVTRLVSDALRAEPAHVQGLADLVQRQTGGNPFFAGQFLTTLVEEGLMQFDVASGAWIWDLPGIEAKGFTSNLVDLMVRRLWRLPSVEQEALKLLACLGNQADFATLTQVLGTSVREMHANLRGAVQAGAILAQGGHYKFLHDRVQEAAYALMAQESRAGVHLRIGRLLLAQAAPGKLNEKIFDIAHHFNLGAALIRDAAEKAQVAELNLQAGRKAKASTAFASACTFLAAGAGALGEEAWQGQYGLALVLHLERAECELLGAHFEQAGGLVDEVLQKARSRLDRAPAYWLRLGLHLLRGELPQAVRTALECLRELGMELPESPTPAQLMAEYEDMRRVQGEQAIESLVDLPVMRDPELLAAMCTLVKLGPASFLIEGLLFPMLVCRISKLSLQHGVSEFSVHGLAGLASFMGPGMQRFDEGERWARLAIALAERHGYAGVKAGAELLMQMAVLWTRPIEVALGWLDAALRSTQATGEVVFACYAFEHRLTDLLACGTPLDQVWRESVAALDFVQKNRFRHVIDVVSGVQSFVQQLRGRGADGLQVDDPVLEERVQQSGVPVAICYHWILQLQRHYLLGDVEAALSCAEKARHLLWSASLNLQSVDYLVYASLAMAAAFPAASVERQDDYRVLFAAHLEALQRLALSCPATFAHKHALVAAEVARLESRAMEAMELYEQATRSAAEHGFVQYQALAGELAGRFYDDRGLTKVAQACLHEARECYVRWGATGKVALLEERHPWLGPTFPANAQPTIEASASHLDVAAVVRMSQTLSSEILLHRLVESLMTTALQHAGAERGLLVLAQGDDQRIEAEATTRGGSVVVRLLDVPATPTDLPDLVLQQVVRTRESVILDDARVRGVYSGDEYIRQQAPRSVLCLPLVKRSELIGVLYLENRLASHAFTPERCSVLGLLSSQAAISLENARLYADLKREDSERRRAEESLRQSEERYALAVAGSDEGIFDWDLLRDRLYLARHTQELLGLNPGEPWRERRQWLGAISFHAHDVEHQIASLRAHIEGRTPAYDVEFRLVLPGGTRCFRQRGVVLRDGSGKAFRMAGTVCDITTQKEAQEELMRLERRLRSAQRLEAMGALAGGIAHDFNNILAAILGYGGRALRSLDKGSDAGRDIESVMAAGERGRALADRILTFARGSAGEHVPVHVEAVTREAVDLMLATLPTRVRIEMKLEGGGAAALGDPTQVHQLVMNLATNAVHAMPDGGTLGIELVLRHEHEARLVTVGSVEAGDYLVLTVSDTGSGMSADLLERIFNPFFTTRKAGIGTGLGLSLVQAIVEDMGGAIEVASHPGRGSAFVVFLPRAGTVEAGGPAPDPPLPRGSGQRILLVDDEEPLVILMAETLQEFGYAASAFTDSTRALEAFRAEPQRFDAVITDERMPGIGGVELIGEIRGLRSDIPILLISGFVGGNLPARARVAGATDVLKKPLSERDLAASLARVLDAG